MATVTAAATTTTRSSLLCCCVLVLVGVVGIAVADDVEVSQVWELDVDLYNFRWVGDEVALVRTDWEGVAQVWRTPDSGQTWSKLNLPSSTEPGKEPGFLYPNTVDPSRVYIRGNGDVSWISVDQGETWEVVHPGERYIQLEWHPTKPDWALAGLVKNSVLEVYLTRDFCRTWSKIGAGFQFAWGDAGQGNIPEDRVYMITEDADGYRNFVTTDDFGVTFSVEQSKAYAFLFRPKQIFVVVLLPTSNEVILKETPYIGSKIRPYYEAEFPFGDTLENNGYSIIDDSTGAVYLGVNHGDLFSHWGNVYVSNSLGNKYVLSNSHVSQYYPFYDFDKLFGIEGVYIANVVDNWNEDVNEKEQDNLQTFLTLDNGGRWQGLKPPHFDSNNKTISCSGKCALHLHGWSGLINDFGPFYSTVNAKGLLLGNGNVGEFLSQEANLVNTYFSRDAGLSWKELKKGPSIYEFGDHGSIIVVATLGESVTSVYYTLDEGTTPLKSIQISSTPVDIINVQTEPTSTGTKFIVICRTLDTQRTVLVGLDFSHVYSRSCIVGSADYEEWAPSGKLDSNCLLGKDVTYRRRKPDAKCFNAESLEHIVSIQYCPCTEDDWECDFGYNPSSTDPDKCDLIGEAPTYPPLWCNPGKTYNKTEGYRQVAGTACQGGVSRWGEGPFDCPVNEQSSSSKAWIAAVVVIPIVLLCLIGSLFAIRSERVRKQVPFLEALASWRIGYFGMQSKPGSFGEGGLMDPDEEFVIGGLDEPKEQERTMVDLQDDKDSFDPRA